jgi:hypothetical protein
MAIQHDEAVVFDERKPKPLKQRQQFARAILYRWTY